MRRFLVALLCCLAVTLPAAAHHGRGAPSGLSGATHYLGVNALDDAGYSSIEQPFLNLLKQSGSNYGFTPWWTRNGSTDTGEENFLAQCYVDSDGYVKSLTATGGIGTCHATPTWTYVETWMNLNIITTSPLPPGACGTYAASTGCSPTPTYRLQFQGKGTIVLAGGAVSSLSCSTSGVTTSGSNTIISTNAWGTTNTCTFIMGGSGGLRFQETALPDSANYIKASSIVDNAYAANYDAGEILHPLWKNALSNTGGNGFARLRAQVLNVNSQDLQLTFTSQLNSGSNSGTLSTVEYGFGTSSTWPLITGSYAVAFATGQNLTCTFTYGSSSMSGCSANFNANIPTSVVGAMAVADLNSNQTGSTGWNARPKLSNASWSLGGGIPMEAILIACNELKADCWIPIPATAVVTAGVNGGGFNNYAIGLANLAFNGSGFVAGSNVTAFTGLISSQKIYPEYSNEISGAWNCSPPYQGGCNLMVMESIFNGFYAAQGNNKGNGSAEQYGTEAATVGDAFFNVYGSSIATRVRVVEAAQFATGNGVAFMKLSMNTPDWTSAAYTHHIGSLSFAPYMPLSNNFSSTDLSFLQTLCSPSPCAAEITELYSLAYTNVGGSSHTYSDMPSDGFVADTYGSNGAAGMKSGWSTQPWASLPVDCYEGGLNADDRKGLGTAWQQILTTFLRDSRQALIYDDIHNTLSASGTGYLQGMLALGITVNKLDLATRTTEAQSSGGWGALELITQTISPIGSAPPAYSGLMNYVNLQ